MRRILGVVLLAVSTFACGGDGGTPTGPSGTPPFNQTLSGNVAVFGVNRHSVTIPRSGNMTVRLTWQDGSVDLDLYLTASGCVELYPLSACNILANSTALAGTSEQVTRSVSSNDALAIFVDNLDLSRAQAYTVTIEVQ
jgi:hypothetical protein